jgi:hypothetical protein
VLGNHIGTTATGSGPLGNIGQGVGLKGATGTLVGDGTSAGANTIAFNSSDGVVVTGGGNRILANSIFSNDRLGINLFGGFQDPTGVTANDEGDPNIGPNGLQNFPVNTSAKSTPGGTVITGNLNSVLDDVYEV